MLNYSRFNETLVCHSLSYGVHTFQDVKNYISKIKNVEQDRINLTIISHNKIKKINDNKINDTIPLLFKKDPLIRFDIEPTIIEKKIINLINSIEI